MQQIVNRFGGPGSSLFERAHFRIAEKTSTAAHHTLGGVAYPSLEAAEKDAKSQSQSSGRTFMVYQFIEFIVPGEARIEKATL